jgi:hypothetical protein
MNRSLKTQLALGIFSAVSCQLYAAGQQSDQAARRPFAIHVYDLADVSARDLHQATKEAGRILATAGVEAVWQFGRAEAPEAHEEDWHFASPGARNQPPDSRNYLVLVLMRDFPAREIPTALGFSLPDAKFGFHATIFYDRVERVSKTGELTLAAMLGHAMAHEIGHVLLGTTEHSPSGIMKAHWGKADCQLASMRRMAFSGPEREAIQTRIVARLSARNQQ